MLPQQPILFISKNFFINFCQLLHRNFSEIEIEEKKKLLFIEELIFQRSTVLFNISNDAIKKSNISDFSNYLKNVEIDEEEKIFLVYINKLHKTLGLIKSCITEMNDYRGFNIEAVQKHSIIPNFILISDHDDIAKNIQDKFGMICLSKDLKKINENIYGLFIQQIEQGAAMIPSDYFKYLPAANTIVIEEPYLLTQNYEYIISLINSIISSRLKLLPFYITLITETSKGNSNHVNRLKEEFLGRAIIEHYEKKLIHDRNIYTNSFWVASDYGFMEKYSKSATKWTAFPLGVYYSHYYERIKKSLTFLTNETTKSNNYLAVGFN